MGALADLQNEKNTILSNISKAASEGRSDLVLSESEKLAKIELLINRHEQIVLALEELRSNKSNANLTQTSVKKEVAEKYNMSRSSRLASSRELGQKLRGEFIKKLDGKGVDLQLIKGKTIFQTKSGKRVGIAVAREGQPNRWFLGLPVGGFELAVLLCQRENGYLLEVPLSEKFFIEHGDSMSQSKGQMKFNIHQIGSRVMVQVTGIGGIDVSSFSIDYSSFS